ncbi:hypothetical protein HDU79_001906 [Rhizoclosmatium sp. JEL0117]|nr:hypothetical protein HDU79_001906 [Rhizoclosmatium sp. JEL0117]
MSFDQVILLGDSLTDFSMRPGGWGLQLVTAFGRKFDVKFRGVTASNSWNLRYMLPSILQETPANRIRLITILIGTNDYTVPDYWTHVNLEVYKENLKVILTEISHKVPNAKVLIMTPPPMSARDWNDGAYLIENAVNYRDACIQTVTALQAEMPNVTLLNLWNVFVPSKAYTNADWDPASISHFFEDELHFGIEGHNLVFANVMKTIVSQWPELNPETMPDMFPPPNTYPNATSNDVEGLKKILFQEARKE